MQTTQEILSQLIQSLNKQYAAQLNQMPMKKQTRECLIDGFRDGVRHGVLHTVKMLGVTVLETKEGGANDLHAPIDK